MDGLVQATLPYGFIPPVVMEFPGITVGGGFAGPSGESSSFRYSFFDRTVSWIEVVLANGDIMTASKDHNSDLFFGAASSFGTLGITTLLKIDLIEAKKYVQLTYHPISAMSEAKDLFQLLTKDQSIDYIDGILFSQTSGVICSGRLTDNASSRVQGFTKSTDPWFYVHAERLIKRPTHNPVREIIPLTDYLFRYDRGGFWTGKYAYRYFVTPFNRITRWALDRFMHTRVMYHALHKSGLAKEYIIQDIAVPYPRASEFSEYLERSFGHYPLWICPLSMAGQAATTNNSLLTDNVAKGPDLMINFGVWGPGPTDRLAFVEANRNLEHTVSSLNGRKWLYALTYHTEEEFWSIYDRKKYDALRAKYDASYLPTIYDKVKADVEAEARAIRESWTKWISTIFWGIWPLSGLYGVYKASVGGDYMLSRNRFSRSLLLVGFLLVLLALSLSHLVSHTRW